MIADVVGAASAATLFAVIVTCLGFVPHSASAESLEGWQQRAAAQSLASHPEWLALLHYEAGLLPGRHRSFVDDAAFFLSEEGPSSPGRELAATLAALFDDPATSCRFVARRQWLAQRLPGLEAALPAAQCPEYEEWRRILGASEARLVFAASYLNSPSSMYGHTFLRFDSATPGRTTPLLAYALNFGANIPADENSLVYAFRGLFGGYPGQFAAGPYFEKLREYSRLENRDLWEYRLNLDAVEIDRLLAHIWELRDINFAYFFFDENCSLRLLELLDVARPGHDLAAQFPNYAIPIDTVRAVLDAGMVAGVDYRPANRTVLESELESFDATERGLARRLADDVAVGAGTAFRSLPPARQRAVAGMAYGYLRYRAVHEVRSEAVVQRSYELLRLVNEVAAPGEPPPAPPRPVAPEDGHRTSLLAISAGLQESRSIADLEWRLSYHDLADAPGGYPAGASLNMGRLVMRLKEGGTLQLQRLDLLEITSLSPRDEFLKPWSWRVNTGLERQWTGGDDVLVPQVNAGVGGTWAPIAALGVHAMITGRVEYNHELDRELDVAPGISAGATLRGGLGVTLIGVDYYHFTDGVDRRALALRHNLPLRTNLALRLGLERSVTDTDRVDEASLALRFYF
jgi:hypothetical protein